MKVSIRLSLISAAAAFASAAHAGPFILAGTDADDHGSVSAGVNQDGWLFMQKSLENLGSSAGLTNTNMQVVSLGSNTGSWAGNAAQSAFDQSLLASSGWSFAQYSDLTDVGFNFATALSTASIIMLDSGGNVSGGLTSAEEAVLTANAGAINSFLAGGGGLFSQAGDYGWLSTLVPGLTVNFQQLSGLQLTAAGNSAFPGLTNADLSAGPYHVNFGNVGSIPVLATGVGNYTGLNVIIGSSGGSITDPTPVGAIPEPSTYALMLGGLGFVSFIARRRRSQA